MAPRRGGESETTGRGSSTSSSAECRFRASGATPSAFPLALEKRRRYLEPSRVERLDRRRSIPASRRQRAGQFTRLCLHLHRSRRVEAECACGLCSRRNGRALPVRDLSRRPARRSGLPRLRRGVRAWARERARARPARRDRGRMRPQARADRRDRRDDRRRRRQGRGGGDGHPRSRKPSTPSIDGVLERHGKLDVLVNNAGGQFLSPAEAITPKGFRTVIELNVVGTWLMTHAAATRAFIPQGGGKVLSVTLSPHAGMPGMVHSGAARAAVENMMKTLSIEWSQHGVKLCALAAGQFDTETVRTKYPAVVVENLAEDDPARALGHRGGVGVAGRLPRLARRRLLLGHDDHDGRRPRQLVRLLASGDVRRPRGFGHRPGRGAQAEALGLDAQSFVGDELDPGSR